MMQFDRKNRDFYDSLTDEEKKKFSNFLMIRYGSAVHGSQDLQEYYLRQTNMQLNKHFFAINKHPKLQWLCATSVSPGVEILKECGGIPRHQWIAPKKKEPGATGIKKQIAELYPNLKADEVELLATINTKKDLDMLLVKMGREKSK